ncbi:MAG TPA: restriction endonuclease subunit S, partial [Solirubrobacteraceae bacterium]|nr:restriction endonuclease subunit S [Solirubrobacteraceae bacterium]
GASRLGQLPLPLPPLAEQRRIVAEAIRRTNELRAAADSLGTALARTHEQDSEVLSVAVAGRTAATDAAPAGLPAGWRLARVDDIGEVRLGRQRSPASHSGPDMRPYLRVANVFEDRIDLSDVKEMNFTPKEAEIYALEPGDILLNEGQSLELVGRPAMYRGELPGACFQNTLVRFRAHPEVDPEFALIVFLHYLRSGEFKRIARGSTNIAHLSRARFAAMPFPVPPIDEQRAIAGEARRLLEESHVRRETIVRSLERIAEVEAEVLVAAVTGALVSQDERDEHAEELLERRGPPPPDRIAVDNAGVKETDVVKEPDNEPPEPGEPELAAVLSRSGPMRIPKLCNAAKFDLNDVGEIERFYLALRKELDVSVEAIGESEENQTLGAVVDAP